jgi:tetratricopeptide (TPR) repeat protein
VPGVFSLSLLALFLLFPGSARGQSAPDRARAVELFSQSEEAYRAGRYSDAIDLLRRAYALQPDPVLLHNIGVAYEKEADYPRAVEAFDRCVREYPTYDRCAQRLETARAAAAAVRRPSPAPAPLAAEPERQVASAWPWVVVSVGAVGLAAGTGLLILAAKRSGDAQNAMSADTAETTHREALGYQTAAVASLIAGGVIALIGGVWVALQMSARHVDRSVAAARTMIGWESARVGGAF